MSVIDKLTIASLALMLGLDNLQNGKGVVATLLFLTAAVNVVAFVALMARRAA